LKDDSTENNTAEVVSEHGGGGGGCGGGGHAGGGIGGHGGGHSGGHGIGHIGGHGLLLGYIPFGYPVLDELKKRRKKLLLAAGYNESEIDPEEKTEKEVKKVTEAGLSWETVHGITDLHLGDWVHGGDEIAIVGKVTDIDPKKSTVEVTCVDNGPDYNTGDKFTFDIKDIHDVAPGTQKKVTEDAGMSSAATAPGGQGVLTGPENPTTAGVLGPTNFQIPDRLGAIRKRLMSKFEYNTKRLDKNA